MHLWFQVSVSGRAIWRRKDEHCEANHHGEKKAKNEGASPLGAVGEVGCDDGQDGSGDVDRDCHQLSGARLVVEILDNGREEQADAVKGADNLYLSQMKPQVSMTCQDG